MAASVAVACSSTPNYFEQLPPAHAGHSGGGATASGGNSVGGSAGTSNAGKTGVGGGSDGGGSGGSGDTGTGGSGGSSGNNDGARGGDTTLGGSGGKGGSGGTGGTGGTGGDFGGLGGGGQSTGGTGSMSESGAAGDVGTAGAGGEPCVGKPEVCDGVSNDCDDEVDEGDVCPVDCSAKAREGHVYLLCITTNEQRQLDYGEATSYCDTAGEELGLDFTLALARVESQPESDFAKAWVRRKTTTDGAVWIGANDLDDENQWVWGRGTSSVKFFTGFNTGGGMPYQGAFNDWAEERPNAANGEDEDCAGMDSEFDWAWNDLVCQNPRIGWLCEQTP